MKKYIVFISIAIMSFTLFSCNEQDFASMKDGSFVKIKGKLSLVGNHPFEKLVLAVEPNHQVILIFKTNESLEKAQSKIGKKVEVTGQFKIHDLVTADGKYTITEHKIMVINIKYPQITL